MQSEPVLPWVHSDSWNHPSLTPPLPSSPCIADLTSLLTTSPPSPALPPLCFTDVSAPGATAATSPQNATDPGAAGGSVLDGGQDPGAVQSNSAVVAPDTASSLAAEGEACIVPGSFSLAPAYCQPGLVGASLRKLLA